MKNPEHGSPRRRSQVTNDVPPDQGCIRRTRQTKPESNASATLTSSIKDKNKREVKTKRDLLFSVDMAQLNSKTRGDTWAKEDDEELLALMRFMNISEQDVDELDAKISRSGFNQRQRQETSLNTGERRRSRIEKTWKNSTHGNSRDQPLKDRVVIKYRI